MKKNGDTSKGTTTKTCLNSTSTHAQRQRLLEALIELGAVNTIYARDSLNIMSPAPRIMELRKQGHEIIKTPITINDRNGFIHSGVARYVLIKLAGD
jgi:hypothetical protein